MVLPVAGSAVNYRNLIMGSDSCKVAITTGSWTLPSARGKGCFTRIIEESLNIANRRGASCLTAFVTQTNASCRRLKAAGFISISSYYLSATNYTDNSLHLERTVDTPDLCKEIFAMSQNRRSGHFTSTFEEWQHQFLDRPSKPEMVFIDKTYLILEHTGDIVRILSIYGDEELALNASLCLARNSQKTLQLFTTSEKTRMYVNRWALL